MYIHSDVINESPATAVYQFKRQLPTQKQSLASVDRDGG
jgi:hypothetical protein